MNTHTQDWRGESLIRHQAPKKETTTTRTGGIPAKLVTAQIGVPVAKPRQAPRFDPTIDEAAYGAMWRALCRAEGHSMKHPEPKPTGGNHTNRKPSNAGRRLPKAIMTEATVAGILLKGPMPSTEIARIIGAKVWQVYDALYRMLIEGKVVKSGSSARRVYTVTEKGRAWLEEYRAAQAGGKP